MEKIIGVLPRFYLEKYQKLISIQNELRSYEPRRKFTIDGNIVGDFGEIVAETFYEVTLDKVSKPDFDGLAKGEEEMPVQIKCSFIGGNYTYKKNIGLFLVLRILNDGRIEEVYNGENTFIQDFLISEPNTRRKITSKGVSYKQLKRVSEGYDGKSLMRRE
ncbi:MAG: DUF6998 domain-containing protein [Lewinella sp.]|uniref:DUF6998 domain-containing protein n=1 Tax=Lewinella sp. TaxID=2004506 RepID=UPI003D6C667A